MITDLTSPVVDAPPPGAVLRLANPVMRALLHTPVSRLIRPLALLQLTGTRSGRNFSVVVGWHIVDGTPVVFTPARWRANFVGGASALVRRRGRRERVVGVLESDPVAVARAINQVLASGTSPRALALRVESGHEITADDVVATRRAMVRFHAAEP
jgi:hypothetical protein